MRAYILVLLLLAAPLAGCLGGGEDGAGSGDEITRSRADPGEDTAVIEGVVTDTAVSPIEKANVTVVELNITVQTRPTGGFEIGPIDPGTYTITARAPGFVSSQQSVDAEAGQTSSIDFLLSHLAEDKPFMQEFEVAGFLTYGWGLGLDVGVGPADGAFVRDNNCDYDALAGPLCRGEFDLEPPLETLIFEMAWEPSSPLAQSFMAMMRVSDNASIITGEWSFFTVEGESPLYHRMDREDLDAVVANFTERCEDGQDEFCSLNFRDNGWPLQTRVWPGYQCPVEQGAFCAVLEQDYTQFVTAFYNAPGPADHAILDDNPS